MVDKRTSQVKREFVNLKSIKLGDILAVKRTLGAYYHFAVYLGNNGVIHYASREKGFGSEISIHETSYACFKGDSEEVFVLEFPDDACQTLKYSLAAISNVMSGYYPRLMEDILFLVHNNNYHLFSPIERNLYLRMLQISTKVFVQGGYH